VLQSAAGLTELIINLDLCFYGSSKCACPIICVAAGGGTWQVADPNEWNETETVADASGRVNQRFDGLADRAGYEPCLVLRIPAPYEPIVARGIDDIIPVCRKCLTGDLVFLGHSNQHVGCF